MSDYEAVFKGSLKKAQKRIEELEEALRFVDKSLRFEKTYFTTHDVLTAIQKALAGGDKDENS